MRRAIDDQRGSRATQTAPSRSVNRHRVGHLYSAETPVAAAVSAGIRGPTRRPIVHGNGSRRAPPAASLKTSHQTEPAKLDQPHQTQSFQSHPQTFRARNSMLFCMRRETTEFFERTYISDHVGKICLVMSILGTVEMNRLPSCSVFSKTDGQ